MSEHKWWQIWKPKCEHEWRPASVRFYDRPSSSPARVCRDCDKRELLTGEQFYAQFGENFYVMANYGANYEAKGGAKQP